MHTDSASRLKQLIQRLGPSRPATPALSDECLAVCEVITGLRAELAALRTRLHRIETRRDGA